MSAGTALAALEKMFAVFNVPVAPEHRTPDLRRGRAKDLQMSGDILHSRRESCALAVAIHTRCAALEDLGDGKVEEPVFLPYLDLHRFVRKGTCRARNCVGVCCFIQVGSRFGNPGAH